MSTAAATSAPQDEQREARAKALQPLTSGLRSFVLISVLEMDVDSRRGPPCPYDARDRGY
jgi:hypothetical protein